MSTPQASAHNSTNEHSTASESTKKQATAPPPSIGHTHTTTKSQSNSLHMSHSASNGGSPSLSPSQQDKRTTSPGKQSHRTATDTTLKLPPIKKGESTESGVSPTTQRSKRTPVAAESNAANAKPKDGGVPIPEVAREKKGRRAPRQNNSNWFETEKTSRPADTELDKHVATVNDGVPDQELARREQAERAQRQAEQLAQHISNPPTGFQATLPRLNELDVTNSWDKLLRMIRNEYDMSCLTNCLARELDEDVPWNPEMLLVQLTSDMMDAAELQQENEVYVPVEASDIGQITGGEVVRKRREKTAPAQGGASAAPEGAAADVGAGKDTGNSNSTKHAADAGGAVSSKPTSSAAATDAHAENSSSKRKGSPALKAGSGTGNAPAKREKKPSGNTKNGIRSLLKR
ncbi:hypothetical protein ABL78_4393 [Leptomonas seymouri]|uniref:Intraflagellar transport protein 43 n=1 Tax=Leptomonas seymouri TaxID=5684 RepID=A0A0N1IKR7_LEPSE|nr:hypothetical protein ABL78_4393 [Leptomonas seymouri]|eukprot:KPI86528.1 hypothetical protein ABL78_4393 [Leptomonas seymouri]